MKKVMENLRQLARADRPLNASRFNEDLALEIGQHCRQIKCGELCNGGHLAHHDCRYPKLMTLIIIAHLRRKSGTQGEGLVLIMPLDKFA